jgi:TfoX/Sxy family transcriptional regulator of competence genes
MASSKSLVEHVVDLASDANGVRAQAMFGEYGIYCGERMVALFCDDTLFVKPTKSGEALVGDVEMDHPYPRGKPCYVIPQEMWDEPGFLSQLFAVTAAELPPSKKRKKKAAQKTG